MSQFQPAAGASTADVGTSLDSRERLLALLDQWVDLGWLRALDSAMARFLDTEADAAGQPPSPLLLLLVALTSHQLGRGHVCLDLELMAKEGFNDALSLPPEDESVPDRCELPSDVLAQVTPEHWQEALGHPLLVAQPGLGYDGRSPLVRAGSRVYLRRFWRYEQTVFQRLQARLGSVPGLEYPTPSQGSEAALISALTVLFPGHQEDVDWQKVACANAARQGFSVITGGPGTGKTTTVVKLLAALQHGAMTSADEPRVLRIQLAAPTGKAAARLNESIAGAVKGLDLGGLPEPELLRAAIPTEVTTLHRLLGAIPGSRRFRHDRLNPLMADVLVIDEASMVDLEMMARVLEALPDDARLILLGDKDQLASVDAGAVLGELCQRAATGHYWPSTGAWLGEVTGYPVPRVLLDEQGKPLDQAITLLRRSYRFDEHSGIGQLAAAVNQGCEGGRSGEQARQLFSAGYADLARIPVPAASADEVMARHCVEGGRESFLNGGEGRQDRGGAIDPPAGYRHYLETMKSSRPDRLAGIEVWDQWAASVLEAFGRFQVLAALRKGRYGVEGLNKQIAARLKAMGLISVTDGWYPGRPVLVTRNDYGLGLMNGDIGIALMIPARQWENGQESVDPEHLVLRVAFPSGDGAGDIRWVLPSRLQQIETVYAMTVHKSQGSEFDHACLVLPDRISPVLTRELVYTGITRAKFWFSLLLPDQGVFDVALARQVNRSSGLGACLFGEG
ncbi:exodeoxyribonuclease V subunit alpha [Marinobacter mobilis]|uniref:RecBCD enzyme subunit RecD n=1 Tax=Marinobacter mobilis TaxID=488533 RepID=A0A1H3BJ91_9GAMM|nr:exodeoxyribonuclease V subunit alpha [Marinobacter mobilis]SDX41865.1 DNA helicase/exodeoxyribonuclease V, alpha subunit [Marinobacter mobilis]